MPVFSISDHAERISNLFPMQSTDKCFPIHQLLSVDPLTKTEIPLYIFEILVGTFDVNEFNNVRLTCLNIAIEHEHYNAVRYLVKQGADCNKATHGFRITDRMTPVAILAQKSNTPLELFDLQHFPQTLNDDSCWHLPLHEAVDCGYSEAALHLTKDVYLDYQLTTMLRRSLTRLTRSCLKNLCHQIQLTYYEVLEEF